MKVTLLPNRAYPWFFWPPVNDWPKLKKVRTKKNDVMITFFITSFFCVFIFLLCYFVYILAQKKKSYFVWFRCLFYCYSCRLYYYASTRCLSCALLAANGRCFNGFRCGVFTDADLADQKTL